MNEEVFAAHKKWREAYNLWKAEANHVLGMSAPVKLMQGEPDTKLRRLYEEVAAAADEYDTIVRRTVVVSD